MRSVDVTSTYKKQYRRLKRAGWNMDLLDHTVEVLATDNQTELVRLWDHALKGDRSGLRAIHVGQRASDWVVEYAVMDDGTLVLLLQTGSHDSVLHV